MIEVMFEVIRYFGLNHSSSLVMCCTALSFATATTTSMLNYCLTYSLENEYIVITRTYVILK